jgi:predicted RNA-binding Zn-ribbon protein involved in translation (DUF1610 family)
MKMYCPACGNYVVVKPWPEIWPDAEIHQTCTNCGTHWIINLRFNEADEEGDTEQGG